jgi:hypothetical protein
MESSIRDERLRWRGGEAFGARRGRKREIQGKLLKAERKVVREVLSVML